MESQHTVMNSKIGVELIPLLKPLSRILLTLHTFVNTLCADQGAGVDKGSLKCVNEYDFRVI